MKKKTFNPSNIGAWTFAGILLVIGIMAPIVLRNFFVSDTNWLSFWGNFLGGLLGAVATFSAFYITYKDNKLQHLTTQAEINDQKRISLLPMLSFVDNANTVIETYNSNRINLGECLTSCHRTLWLKNVGQATAARVILEVQSINPLDLGHIEKDGLYKISIDSPNYKEKKVYTIVLKYSDLSGKKYSQSCDLIIDPINPDRISITSTTYPEPV